MGSVVTFGLESKILKRIEDGRSEDEVVLICKESDRFMNVLKELEQRKENLEVVVLGQDFKEPVQMAQRVHAVDKTISIIVITRKKDMSRIQQAFQFALFVGYNIECVEEDDLENILKVIDTAIRQTRSRRRNVELLKRANLSLATLPMHAPKMAEVYLDKLLDYAPMAVALLNQEGRILAWNRKANEIAGHSEREVLTRSFDHLFKLDLKENFSGLCQRALSTGESVTFEVTSRAVPGRYFEVTLGSLGPKEVDNLMLLFHDVTDKHIAELALRNAKESAEAANQAKSRFLANMSHEIRTPIGAMLGFLELMKQPDTTPKQLSEHIATIDRNGHQLLRLIDDILDLSKIEAGKIQINIARISLIEILADISSLMGFRAREKGLRFEIKFLNNLPELIFSDAVRIRQILANIIGNAVKFTSRGSVTLRVDYNPSELSFIVTDTGIGLSQDHAERLFKPFSQADPSITRKFGGTGLGLALSKKLANALGGDLRLGSTTVESGSTFKFVLPVAVVPTSSFVGVESLNSIRARSVPEPPKIKNSLMLMKILIVEDSPDNQKLISLFLAGEGAEVDLSPDGLDGIEKATSRTYDVILMDMQMPICGGLEATKRLRDLGYDRPIVALTAHAMDDERRKAFAAGCTDYLTKPISREKLVSVLSRYKS